MKELKFRVWDKDEKKMIYFDLLELSDWGFDKIQSYFHPFNEMEVTQYTGLHDKNGKEIYEGDIIERNGIKAEVKFELEGCIEIYSFAGYDTNNFLMGKIVGNIHENPELING